MRAPVGKGEDNGGATTQGVTKDAVKVVVLVPTADQQDQAAKQPGATPPIDQASGAVGSQEDGFRDFFEVYEHWIQTWGRKVTLAFVHPTGADETAQRADALKISEMKPFAVVDVGGTYGGGAVFDSVLARDRIIVITTGADACARQQRRRDQAGAVPVGQSGHRDLRDQRRRVRRQVAVGTQGAMGGGRRAAHEDPQARRGVSHRGW